VLSFLTVNVDVELEILVVTSTMLDVFTGSFVKGVGFDVLGFGFVTPIVPIVESAVDDSGFVLSVVVVVLVYSGLVVFVVVLVILVGFNFVVEDNGLVVVDLLIVVLAVVDGVIVVILIVDDFVVVSKTVFGVVVLIDTF